MKNTMKHLFFGLAALFIASCATKIQEKRNQRNRNAGDLQRNQNALQIRIGNGANGQLL